MEEQIALNNWRAKVKEIRKVCPNYSEGTKAQFLSFFRRNKKHLDETSEYLGQKEKKEAEINEFRLIVDDFKQESF